MKHRLSQSKSGAHFQCSVGLPARCSPHTVINTEMRTNEIITQHRNGTEVNEILIHHKNEIVISKIITHHSHEAVINEILNHYSFEILFSETIIHRNNDITINEIISHHNNGITINEITTHQSNEIRTKSPLTTAMRSERNRHSPQHWDHEERHEETELEVVDQVVRVRHTL